MSNVLATVVAAIVADLVDALVYTVVDSVVATAVVALLDFLFLPVECNASTPKLLGYSLVDDSKISITIK